MAGRGRGRSGDHVPIPQIEIPTVKWKEGGLLVARPSRGLPPRDQLSIRN